MPPYDLWLRGPEQVGQWLLGQGFACRGSRLVPLHANGSPAFAQYKLSDEPGVRKPWAIVVLETDGGGSRRSAASSATSTSRPSACRSSCARG